MIFASIFCITILLPVPNLTPIPSTLLIILAHHVRQAAFRDVVPVCRLVNCPPPSPPLPPTCLRFAPVRRIVDCSSRSPSPLDVCHRVPPHLGGVLAGAAMVSVCQLPLEVTSGSYAHRHAHSRSLFQQRELVDLLCFPEIFFTRATSSGCASSLPPNSHTILPTYPFFSSPSNSDPIPDSRSLASWSSSPSPLGDSSHLSIERPLLALPLYALACATPWPRSPPPPPRAR